MKKLILKGLLGNLHWILFIIFVSIFIRFVILNDDKVTCKHNLDIRLESENSFEMLFIDWSENTVHIDIEELCTYPPNINIEWTNINPCK